MENQKPDKNIIINSEDDYNNALKILEECFEKACKDIELRERQQNRFLKIILKAVKFFETKVLGIYTDDDI